MDLIAIGKFIASCRKDVGLTQMQLAEKLNVTDKAVSKWETGKSMPDSSIMLALCGELNITVNDLLNGKVVSMEKYNEKLEQSLLEVIKQKEEADKRLLQLEWVVGILSLIIIVAPVFIGSYALETGIIEEWKGTLISLSGFIPAIPGLLFAIKIEQVAGYYECSNCHHRYIPTFGSIGWAPHLGRTRYLKCPKCNERTWNRKRISKG